MTTANPPANIAVTVTRAFMACTAKRLRWLQPSRPPSRRATTTVLDGQGVAVSDAVRPVVRRFVEGLVVSCPGVTDDVVELVAMHPRVGRDRPDYVGDLIAGRVAVLGGGHGSGVVVDWQGPPVSPLGGHLAR